jgi:predicted aconitase with swiveling domain
VRGLRGGGTRRARRYGVAVVSDPGGAGESTDRSGHTHPGALARGRVLVAGGGRGPLLRLRAPISFWGGVDPASGRVADPRHPDHDACIAGTVLAVPRAVGSSSSSAIMLELIREGTAPAAILMGEADAILALGVVVARELGHPGIPVLEVPAGDLAALPQGELVVHEDGSVCLGR